MIQTKRVLLLLTAGLVMSAGSLRADDKVAASTPQATPAAQAAAVKPVKGESPTVTAMKAAIALSDEGKYDEAIAAYEKIGTLKSKNMEAWRLNNEALAYLMNNKADQAVPLLEKATTTNDKNYVAWNNLGTAYESTNQLDKAKDAYQKSIDAAKEANASSAKAEGNLAALQARLDKMEAKNGGTKPAADAAASTPAPAGK